MTHVCITLDVEGDSASNKYSTFYGIKLVLPELVTLFSKYGIEATFFVQEDEFCKVGSRFSKYWKALADDNHEIGLHTHGLIQYSKNKMCSVIKNGIQELRNLGLNEMSPLLISTPSSAHRLRTSSFT